MRAISLTRLTTAAMIVSLALGTAACGGGDTTTNASGNGIAEAPVIDNALDNVTDINAMEPIENQTSADASAAGAEKPVVEKPAKPKPEIETPSTESAAQDDAVSNAQ